MKTPTPFPFDKNELGIMFMAMELMLGLGYKKVSLNAIVKGRIIMDKVRDHFIAAGGDPKELES